MGDGFCCFVFILVVVESLPHLRKECSLPAVNGLVAFCKICIFTPPVAYPRSASLHASLSAAGKLCACVT